MNYNGTFLELNNTKFPVRTVMIKYGIQFSKFFFSHDINLL